MENVIRDGIPKEGIDSLVRKMISKSRYVSVGQYLRYCHECVREEIRKYGETYWHRQPQLSGVRTCPKHGCLIKNSSAPFEKMRVRIYPASYVLRNMDDDTESQDLQYKEEYLSLAKETEWLLENGRRFGGHQSISNKYREFMREQNYADFRGTAVNREALRHDFIEKYGETFIAELLPYDGDPLYWLRYLQEALDLTSAQSITSC